MSRSVTSSPLTPRDLSERLSSAEARRDEIIKLRKENIGDKLASVQTKKEELISEKTNRVREELENKLKSHEENRDAIITKTKEDIKAYLSKVESRVKEQEVANEAEKIAIKIAIGASTDKADENRARQMEDRIKQLQEHEDYVKSVIVNQEMKKKQYLANLELSLDKASKRKEEELSRKLESVKTEEVKIAEARERREKEEKDLQERTLASLTEKLCKVEKVCTLYYLNEIVFINYFVETSFKGRFP